MRTINNSKIIEKHIYKQLILINLKLAFSHTLPIFN